MNRSPPPAIDSARVLAYAILGDSVQWTGRQKLFHGGKEVGPVPCLALCENAWGDWKEIHIFHCNAEWDVLGAGGASTLEEAQASAERSYRGIGEKWVFLNTTKEEAREWIRKESADVLCSFCDRIPAEMNKMISGKSASICNYCAAELHGLMERDAKGTDAV
jgi:hypothetical protein